MHDDLPLVLLFVAIVLSTGAAMAAANRRVSVPLFALALLAFVGFIISVVAGDALLTANVETLTLGR